jgi:hypothetical protein
VSKESVLALFPHNKILNQSDHPDDDKPTWCITFIMPVDDLTYLDVVALAHLAGKTRDFANDLEYETK